MERAKFAGVYTHDGAGTIVVRYSWEQRKLNRVADFYTGNGLNWNDVLENGKQECILYGNLYTDYGMIADTVVYRTNA